MPFKEGKEASDGILKVLNFMKQTDGFSEYVTEDIDDHFIKWAQQCRSGRYEQLPGMEMYQHDGVDSNGFDLWLRTTGGKCENYHQKLLGCGPFGMDDTSEATTHGNRSCLQHGSRGLIRQMDFGAQR